MENTEKQFEKFYENIKLTSAQRQDAKDKYGGVCKKLHDTYYPDLKYNGDTKLLIGSYGKHTHIRPARDVDVIFIMPPEKFAQYDDNRSNKQSQLLQDIKSILEIKYPDTLISAFGKIVKLEFADTKHDIELVPAWENDNGTFTIPNSENRGSWEVQDYRREISDIFDSDNITGKTRFLIRCIKKWSDRCTVKLKSLKIENTVLNFFLYKDVSNYSSASLFKEFFQYFYQQADIENLKSHLNTALVRAKKACDFEAAGKIDEAAEEWKKIFGDDFPKSQVQANEKLTLNDFISAQQRKYPSPDEEYLDQKYDIHFEINPLYIVRVEVLINQSGWRSNYWLLSQFKKMGYRISKHAKLEFSIVKNTVPAPYQIKWKVRNFGDEAQGLNGLRGEITDDGGEGKKKENTLYHGEHYVQCYIIKDNKKCVAVGEVFIPIQ